MDYFLAILAFIGLAAVSGVLGYFLAMVVDKLFSKIKGEM